MNCKFLLFLMAIGLLVPSTATAQVFTDIKFQLNLRYDDPANETGGGEWDLLIRQDGTEAAGTFGIAGVKVVLNNVIESSIGDGGGLAFQTGDPANDHPWGGMLFYSTDEVGQNQVEIVSGQDLDNGNAVKFIGTDYTAPFDSNDHPVGNNGALDDNDQWVDGQGAVRLDDLWAGAPDNSFNQYALVARGRFGSTRPTFDTVAGNVYESNTTFGDPPVLSTNVVVATISADNGIIVRGDGVATDGLIPGDANRDGTVDGLDFSILASVANFGQQPRGWDDGDFDSNGLVNGLDFSILASVDNFGQTAPSPPAPSALSAVPEPTSLMTMIIGTLASLAATRYRRHA